MIIPFEFKAAPANVQSQEHEMDLIGQLKIRDCCVHIFFTKKMAVDGRTLQELTECRTTSGQGETDYVFTLLMLGTHSQSWSFPDVEHLLGRYLLYNAAYIHSEAN